LKLLKTSRSTRKKQRHERTKKWSKNIKNEDLVLKRKKNWENPGKLQEPWEGPFIAKETSMLGAFRLLNQTGEEPPYLWNAYSLKRYYP
jgi:hypothetical protein